MKQRGSLEQWQLTESSAEAYERYLVPILFAPGAQYLVELAQLRSGARVLDVACGTGSVARQAAQRVGPTGKLVGLDLNEHMLAVARKASAGADAPIEWRQGDAAALPFPDDQFDVVFCQQGLQFMPDRSAALREMRRTLVAGGRLVISFLRPIEYNPGYAVLADVLEHYLGPEAGAMMRAPFAALRKAELRDLVVGAGFEDVRMLLGIGPVRYPSVEELVHWELASSPIGASYHSLESQSDTRYAALVQELSAALREYTDDEGVIFPAETYLITARS